MQRRSVIGAVVLAGVLMLGAPELVTAQGARHIAQATFPSVVMLVMQNVDGKDVALGSGFFVSDDVVATNLHVVYRGAGGYAKLVGQEKRYKLLGLVGADRHNDLALVKVESITGRALTLGEDESVEVGDEVYAVGNPVGLEGTFSQGLVSATRQIEGRRLLQITAPISPGSSGGPVLDVQGRVVGVAVATRTDGQNLNFAVPVAQLRRLVTRMTALEPFGTPHAARIPAGADRPRPRAGVEDGAPMVLVPAGVFIMGANANGAVVAENETPSRGVSLDAFYIDTHEVTIARYTAFLDANGFDRRQFWSPDGWRFRYSERLRPLPRAPGTSTQRRPGEQLEEPAMVTWYEAEAYCGWAGKRLPTEAEWEKAARGTDGRRYPWGDDWQAGKANVGAGREPRAVGSFEGDLSPYGVVDLAGNAPEWVSDWYDARYYSHAPAKNPRGPATGQRKVRRGGDYVSDPAGARVTARGALPLTGASLAGFRCARNASE